jgi:alpha-1,4-N-acetylglucosaminyltransferase EXTL3
MDSCSHNILRSANGGFLSWLRHPQRGLPYLICCILIILVILPFLVHYYLASFAIEDFTTIGSVRSAKMERSSKFGAAKTSDMKLQIDELRAIRASVSNELLELEKKRQTLLAEISQYSAAIDTMKQNYQITTEELERLKVTFVNLQVEQKEMLKNNLPIIVAPQRILPKLSDGANISSSDKHENCRLSSCFDYSRCSVTSQFPVYVYPPEETSLSSGLDSFVKYSTMHALDSSPHVTFDPHIACLYVVLVSEKVAAEHSSSEVELMLKQLPYWHGNGLNHVLVNIARQPSSLVGLKPFKTGAAMLAQSFFYFDHFRPTFDIVLPVSLGISHGDVWDQLAMIVPARRQYLLCFVSELQIAKLPNSSLDYHDHSQGYDDNVIVNVLKNMLIHYQSDGFQFEFLCINGTKMASVDREWTLCGTAKDRRKLLERSTFCLIVAPLNHNILSTTVIHTWLFEILQSASVPVILGDHIKLPFSEIIHWPRAVIFLPKARVTELHFILRSFTDADILEMRRQGRMVFESFFGSTKSIIDATLATIRRRVHIPAFPIRDEPSPSVFNDSFVPLLEPVVESVMEADEMLGPVEPPLASPRYYRNFTYSDVISLPSDLFHSYPFTPFEPVMPADAKFVGSSYGFRPIGQGVGGAGKEFSEALGGNVAREQFTVVILTFEREAVLINAISRLKGLPHLNKVVVVWNSPHSPPEDLHWPDIGVHVHVIKTSHNSLNNRFLPYDAIETEAILSVDDDAHLRHDEIMFAFRIWRESRDRIVGFPGRYIAWDGLHHGWLYNSNYSCELSMVLTGAAFLHKYYLYVYSFIMPQSIRDKVDEYLNCEDIAMNFLVSHITRKPPIKVTSRWTFRCSGCPKALSVEESHFNERHKCINFFVNVYGYMPLLNTQFRADSILFKTRIPHDKQKCFKFI